jgi:multimeric flavodoxin WrbA
MKILGISGCPGLGGNTDRMVKAVLAESGAETNFYL